MRIRTSSSQRSGRSHRRLQRHAKKPPARLAMSAAARSVGNDGKGQATNNLNPDQARGKQRARRCALARVNGREPPDRSYGHAAISRAARRSADYSDPQTRSGCCHECRCREDASDGHGRRAVDQIDEFLRHDDAPLPDLNIGIGRWRLTGGREIVAPDDLNRNFRELHEVRQRNRRSGDRAERTCGQRRRHLLRPGTPA